MTPKIVTAAILRRGSQILIARRHDGKHAGQWEFPGGKLEPGESEQACLERELLEELGIKTIVGELLCENVHRYDAGEIRLRAYETNWVSGDLATTVHDKVEWVEPGELSSYPLLPADVPIAATLARSCYATAAAKVENRSPGNG